MIKSGQVPKADQIGMLEDYYRKLGILQREELWQGLDHYFAEKPASPSNVAEYYSYWRWYVDLTWSDFNGLDRDFLQKKAFSWQIPMAIALDYDVMHILMSYLLIKPVDRPNMEALYAAVRNSFLSSGSYLGKWEDTSYTIADLVKDIQILDSRNDSIAGAEYRNKLAQILSPKDDPVAAEYFFADINNAVDRIINLAVFFLGVNQDYIWFVVETYWHPEKYEQAPEAAAGQKTVAGLVGAAAGQQATPKPEPKKEPPFIPAQIKSQIDSQFKKDETGQYEDLEGVFAKLTELSETNKDPKIAEMYYFDAKAGEFKWTV